MAKEKTPKIQALESLLQAYDLMMAQVSSDELLASNLFTAWIQQVTATLMIANMEFERQIWNQVRNIPVSLHERASFIAYGLGMRAMLLGIIDAVQQEEAKREV